MSLSAQVKRLDDLKAEHSDALQSWSKAEEALKTQIQKMKEQESMEVRVREQFEKVRQDWEEKSMVPLMYSGQTFDEVIPFQPSDALIA